MKKQRRIVDELTTTKEHYKMYKIGKSWAYTMILVASVSLGATLTEKTVAKAAETTPVTQTTDQANQNSNTVMLTSKEATSINQQQGDNDSTAGDTQVVSTPATEKPLTQAPEQPIVTTDTEQPVVTKAVTNSEPGNSSTKLEGREAPVDESGYLITAKDDNGNYSLDPAATSHPKVAVDTTNIDDYMEAHKIDGTPIEFTGDSVAMTDGYEEMDINNVKKFPKSTALITTMQQIDFSKDFSMDASVFINWDNKMISSPWGYGGDGMGLLFENIPPAEAIETAQEGGGIGVSDKDVDKIAYIISANAMNESPKGDYDKNSWIIYQAQDGNPQQAINTADNQPIVTGVTTALSDAKPSKSISYSFIVNYTANDKKLTTVVKDETGADVTTWNYVVPDEYVGKFFTMVVTGASAASRAAYTAKINSYTYQATTAKLNVTSSGLQDGSTGPAQTGIVGMAGSTVAFYRDGTTAPTVTDDGKAVAVAIPVKDVGTDYLAANQFTVLSDLENSVDLVFTHDATAKVIYVTDDGQTISDTQEVSGPVGSSQAYTVTNPDPENYYFAENDQPATGTLTVTDDTNDDVTIQLKHVITASVQPINTLGEAIAGGLVTAFKGKPGDIIDLTKLSAITGYTVVPDQTLFIPDEDGNLNVVYQANPQKATVQFVTVDGSGTKEIAKSLSLNGVTDEAVNHAEVAAAIQAILDKGYSLGNADGTLNAVFDNNDGQDQVFKIVFKPVNQVALNVTLVPVGEDNVPLTNATSTTISGLPGTTIDPENYPEIDGYTVVPNQEKFFPDQPDQQLKIVYTAETQTATVVFLDDNSQQLVPDQQITGKTGTAVGRQQISPSIQFLINQGYKLVTDGALNAVFDTDSKTPQTIKVLFAKNAVSQLATSLIPVTEDGHMLFTTPTTVTGAPGDVVSESDYPEVNGYTAVPDQKIVIPDLPTGTLVKYVPNEQSATIKFIADGQEIAGPVEISGLTNTAVDHGQVAPIIQSLINQGYKLVTDGTLNGKFDSDDVSLQTFKVVLAKNTPSQLTTSLIPITEDGKMLLTTPTTATGEPGEAIDENGYPLVDGYTAVPDQKLTIPNVPAGTLVKYTADTQTAVVAFVDENGQPIIPSQALTGLTRTPLDHNQVEAYIQDALNKGYRLVSDGTVNAKFDSNSQSVQGFKVVLAQIPPATSTVTETGEPTKTPEAPITPVAEAGQPVEEAPTSTTPEKVMETAASGDEKVNNKSADNNDNQPNTASTTMNVQRDSTNSESFETGQADKTPQLADQQAINQLPQTSEQEAQINSVIGILLLSLATLLGLVTKRKREH
ncbi:mucin-binding protein [Secundilactobacillus yichangensis]|uniref:mucin-binding protein n=1 Tax=Secundilactobacillus yichangensis TaxID=2799580 RepID=UPI001943ECF6|nr:MucBP domain-containing protein [Secundilactobacillus yichangensis]